MKRIGRGVVMLMLIAHQYAMIGLHRVQVGRRSPSEVELKEADGC